MCSFDIAHVTYQIFNFYLLGKPRLSQRAFLLSMTHCGITCFLESDEVGNGFSYKSVECVRNVSR